MDLQQLINTAADSAERGDNGVAAESYQIVLTALLANRPNLPPAELDQAIRSVAFNLAQVLNKLRRYKEALESIGAGMVRNPTPSGLAIALAAKGEALCGLSLMSEAMIAFEGAARAHPITGRLNSAESMLRIGMPELVTVASQWVEKVVSLSGAQLNATQRAEVTTLRRQIADRKPASAATSNRTVVEKLVEEANRLAREPGKLAVAADLLEQALKESPVLREKYEYRLQLWRKGISM